MKQYYFILLISLLLSSCSEKNLVVAQTTPFETYEDRDGDKNLLGEVHKSLLEEEPYHSWFRSSTTYLPDPEILKQLKGQIHNYDIEVFFGTWCSDSKREIPRFYKILEETNYDLRRLHIYAVGNEGNLYKKTKQGFEDGKNITHVPTFIFYQNGVEMNRIVEEITGNSLEEDILKIVSGEDYSHKYADF